MPLTRQHEVILYMLDKPHEKLVVYIGSKRDCQRIAKSLTNPHQWAVDRRPDVHTFGNLVCAVDFHHEEGDE